MGKKKYINTFHVRNSDQKDVMDKIAENNICPFCEENLLKFHRGTILKKTKYWTLVHNQWPYKNTRSHLLMISRIHIENLDNIDSKVWNDLLSLAKWTVKKYKISGGAFTMRFGDSILTGATVHHLHAHLIQPKREKGKKTAKTVNFYIG